MRHRRHASALVAALTVPISITGCQTLDTISDELAAYSSDPTRAEMLGAVIEALDQGVRVAVDSLGVPDGFYADPQLRVPLPEDLDSVAVMARRLGQGETVDRFERALNEGAEQAVARGYPVFERALREMTIDDVVGILEGPDDAATRYFRDRTEPELRRRFLPVVAAATDRSGVTRSYKRLLDAVPGALRSALDLGVEDLDRYVLDHSVDALFVRVASEERAIREQPVKRTTALMQRVFAAFET